MNQDTAVVVYAGRRAPSVQIANGLREVGGMPLAEYNLRRLRAGFEAVAGRFLAVAHSQERLRNLEQRMKAAGGETVHAPELGMFAALEGVARRFPELRRMLVYADHAAFPDCLLGAQMLEQHVRSGARCTIAPEYPVGLAPLIVDTSHLPSLLPIDLRPPQNLAELDPFIGACHALMVAAAEPSAAAQFGVAGYHPAGIGYEALTAFPPVALVFDRHGEAAARQTAQWTGDRPSPGGQAVQKYKQFLIASAYSKPAVAAQNGGAASSALPVLFSALTTDFTGAEQSLLLLLRALDRTRIHPVLAVPFDCLLARRAAAAGITVEVADFEFQEIGSYNLEYCHALLRAYRIEAVHVDFTLNPSLMVAATQRNLPIVGHVRTPLPRGLPDVVSLIQRFVCISDFVAATVRRANVPADRVVRHYNGVDRAIFYPEAHDGAALRREKGIASGAFVITLVARIVPYKRHDLLIEALSILRTEVPCAIAVFVGEAMQAKDEIQLRDSIARLGVQDSVKFWGYELQISRVYSVSDVVLVCSTSEAFGRSVVEGMAMGVPAVVPRGTGSAELVEHEVNGLHYEPGDARDLASQLARLATDPLLRARCRQAALAHSASFDIGSHARGMQNLYVELARTPAERTQTSAARSST